MFCEKFKFVSLIKRKVQSFKCIKSDVCGRPFFANPVSSHNFLIYFLTLLLFIISMIKLSELHNKGNILTKCVHTDTLHQHEQIHM